MSDQAQIEQDLAKTRARMDERLSQLQERLTPNRIVNDLMSYVQGSDTGEFASTLMASAKRNPIPAVITGIGMAWLMASNTRDRGASTSAGVPERWSNVDEFRDHVTRAESSVMRHPDEDEATFKGRLHDAMGGCARNRPFCAGYCGDLRVQAGRECFEDQAAAGGRHARPTRLWCQRYAWCWRERGESAADDDRRRSSSRQPVGRRGKCGARCRRRDVRLGHGQPDHPRRFRPRHWRSSRRTGSADRSRRERAGRHGWAGSHGAARRCAGGRGSRWHGGAAGAAGGRDTVHAHGLAGEKGLGALANEAGTGKLSGGIAEVAKNALKAADDAIHQDKGSTS